MEYLPNRLVAAVTIALLLAFGWLGWTVVNGGAQPANAPVLAFWVVGIGFFLMSGVSLIRFLGAFPTRSGLRDITLAILAFVGFFCTSPLGLMSILGLPFLVPYSAFVVIIVIGLMFKSITDETARTHRFPCAAVSMIVYLLISCVLGVLAFYSIAEEGSFWAYMLRIVIWMYATLLGFLVGTILTGFGGNPTERLGKLILPSSAAVACSIAAFLYELIQVFGIGAVIAYALLIAFDILLMAIWFRTSPTRADSILLH